MSQVQEAVPFVPPEISRSRILSREYMGLPIPVWGALISGLFMIVGWHWDICWHRSIGRDTIWTPPHVVVYAALVVAFFYNAWLVLERTFGSDNDTPAISVLWFRGPAGAFLALGGILLQGTAVIWDQWWHETYGLDTAVFTPSHLLLGHGVNFFYLGQCLLIISFRNKNPGKRDLATKWATVLVWSFFLGIIAQGSEAAWGPMGMRTAAFTRSSALAFPWALVLMQSYLRWRWGATAVAGSYMFLTILIMQVFQLFPATPQFGPVYHRVEHFLPPPFPLLLVVPTLAMMPLLAHLDTNKHRLRTYLSLGLVWVVAFNVTNWLFSAFLLSPAGDNFFFAGGEPGMFFEKDFRPSVPLGFDIFGIFSIFAAIVFAAFSCWMGHVAGRWLRTVVR